MKIETKFDVGQVVRVTGEVLGGHLHIVAIIIGGAPNGVYYRGFWDSGCWEGGRLATFKESNLSQLQQQEPRNG